MTLVWLLVQAGVDGAAWRAARSRRRPGPIIGWFALTCFVGVCSALILGEGPFGKMRLTTWAMYGHAPVGLIAAAWLLWRDHRRWALTGAATAVALFAVWVDAFWIEPTWLEVSHHTIASPKVKARIRIAVLSDVQTDHVGAWEQSVFTRTAAGPFPAPPSSM